MIKNLLKILISILFLLIIFIAYLAYFGVTTSKFNNVIKDQVKKQNSNLDILAWFALLLRGPYLFYIPKMNYDS